MGLEARRLTIDLERSGLGCLARMKFGNLMRTWYCSGTLMSLKQYGDEGLGRTMLRVMPVNMREFRTHLYPSTTIGRTMMRRIVI